MISNTQVREQTFQLGTRDEGIMGPTVQQGGLSGNKAEAGRDHERVGLDEEVEDEDETGKNGKAVLEPEPKLPPLLCRQGEFSGLQRSKPLDNWMHVCVSVEERNDNRNRTEYKKHGRNYSNDKDKNKPIKSTEGNEKKKATKNQMKWSQMLKSTKTTGLGFASSFL